MAKRLEGKVAIVTGAAGGIGEACVRLFARHGAKVMFGDIQHSQGKEIETALKNDGYDAEYAPLDVTREDHWSELAAHCVKRFGTITTLINNAGISIPHGLEQGTREEWDRTIAINQTGVWLGMRAVMPELLKQRGSITNVSSSYGLIGVAGFTAYTASKAAVRLISKSVAMEYGPKGVRCNSIHPGPTMTPLAKSMLSEQDILRYEQTIPLRSMGTPDDIAYGALYLSSDEARWVTGSELIVDGGRTCGR